MGASWPSERDMARGTGCFVKKELWWRMVVVVAGEAPDVGWLHPVKNWGRQVAFWLFRWCYSARLTRCGMLWPAGRAADALTLGGGPSRPLGRLARAPRRIARGAAPRRRPAAFLATLTFLVCPPLVVGNPLRCGVLPLTSFFAEMAPSPCGLQICVWRLRSPSLPADPLPRFGSPPRCCAPPPSPSALRATYRGGGARRRRSLFARARMGAHGCAN